VEAYVHQSPNYPEMEVRVRVAFDEFTKRFNALMPELLDIIVKEAAKGLVERLEREITEKLDKNQIAWDVADKLVEKYFIDAAKEIDGKTIANVATAQAGNIFLKKLLPEVK
jgi:hypothetical protein